MRRFMRGRVMRWIIRLLVVWVILGGLFYMFGMQVLIDAMNEKTRAEGYQQCMAQLTNDKTIGHANSPLNLEQGTNYCHCVSDTLTLTKEDMMELVKQRVQMKEQTPPAGFTKRAQELANNCTTELQRNLGFLPAESAAPAATPESSDLIPLN